MPKNLHIKTQHGLASFLEKLVELSVADALEPIMEDERAKQRQVAKDTEAFRAPPSSKADEEVEEVEDEESEEAKKPEKDLTKLGSADKTDKKATVPGPEEVMAASINDIVAKLNVMRSGKSLKDGDVRNELSDYFDSLSSGEKQSLYVFLSGLSQIMSSGVDGQAAPDPGQVGIQVKPKSAEVGSSNKDKEKPAASKQQSTRSDTPIIVGEHARKSEMLRKVRKLMRG
tara:strand:+ start:1491 stop:2177 length:687 start_codon:yes stop_codon:yes gene_type:complete